MGMGGGGGVDVDHIAALVLSVTADATAAAETVTSERHGSLQEWHASVHVHEAATKLFSEELRVALQLPQHGQVAFDQFARIILAMRQEKAAARAKAGAEAEAEVAGRCGGTQYFRTCAHTTHPWTPRWGKHVDNNPISVASSNAPSQQRHHDVSPVVPRAAPREQQSGMCRGATGASPVVLLRHFLSPDSPVP